MKASTNWTSKNNQGEQPTTTKGEIQAKQKTTNEGRKANNQGGDQH